MATEYSRKGLIGVLTPQANTTVEPEFWTLMPPGFCALNARLTCSNSSLESRLIYYIQHLEEFALQFGNSPLNVLILACTGSSYLIGSKLEEEILSNLSKKMNLPVLSSAMSIVKALKQLNAKKIALASPYPDELNKASTQYWQSHDFEIVGVSKVHTPTNTFHSIYSIESDHAHQSVSDLLTLSADAIVMLGTGMPSLNSILKLNESKSEIPILSSMLASVWASVSLVSDDFSSLVPWLSGEIWRERFLSMNRYE